MDRFTDLQSFIAVAETGSVSQAAQRLGTTKSVVSRRLSDLESRLGARLVNRVPRGLTLTEAGIRFVDRARQIVADLGEAEDEAGCDQAAPRGTLRIAAPMTFGTLYLSPALGEFTAAYPHIDLDLDLDDRMVDLVHGGYDLGVRIGRLPESSMVARTVAPHRHILVASPGYLARNGAPAHPDALKDHDCLLYSNREHSPTWSLTSGAGRKSFRIRARMRSNNGDVLRDAAVAGMGIALLPTFIAGSAVRSGDLRAILPDHVPPASAISAIYPASRHLPSKVRVFVDFLRSRFGPNPPWDEGLFPAPAAAPALVDA